MMHCTWRDIDPQALREYIHHRGKTIIGLADKMNLNPKILQDRLSGKSEFKAWEFESICMLLGVKSKQFTVLKQPWKKKGKLQ